MTSWTLSFIGVSSGLLAGIVVAIVSSRMPSSLKREWWIDAHDYLDLPLKPYFTEKAGTKSELIKSWRFWIIESLCAAIGCLLFLRLGITAESLTFSILFWTLVTVAVIDYETMYIPDKIVIPMIWAGLLFYAFNVPEDLSSHVFGAVVGYCILRWLPVGQGDAKLCAAAGAWVGVESLLTFFTIGASLGVAAGLIYLVIRGKSEPCPYGPPLVVGFIITLGMQLINY